MQKKNRLPPTSTFHIYCNLDDRFDRTVKAVSRNIRREFNPKFVFDGVDYQPHLTIYLFAAPIRNQKLIVGGFAKVLEETSSIQMLTKNIFLSYDGWLMIEFKNIDMLKNIHRKTVGEINDLREGILRKKYRKSGAFDEMPADEEEVLKKYGDRHSMKLFNPHVSLAKFDTYEAGVDAKKKYEKTFKDMTVRISSVELVRTYESIGGVGRVLCKKNVF